MNERQLAKDLLKHSPATPQPSVDQITFQILARDRLKIRIVTAMTVVTWLAAVALIMTVLVMLGLIFPKQAQLMRDTELGKLTVEERTIIQSVHIVAFQKAALLVAFSVSILSAAALCSLLLTFMVRRATLRQINASLLQISDQLKRLSAPPPASP